MFEYKKITTVTSEKKSILIIDDDKFLLDMYSLKFTDEGFDVESMLYSKDVLEKLEKEEYIPDIILMDLVMPGIDGFELLKEFKDKKLTPKTSLIILSNLGEKAEIDRAKSLGADGYIIKANTTPSEVVKRVREMVN